MPQAYNRSVYEVFGGLRERWPNLTTVAALNWEEMPTDIPVTVWVDEYADCKMMMLSRLVVLSVSLT